MARETIKIEIDDASLDAAIAKMNLALAKSRRVIGGRSGGASRAISDEADAVEKLLTNIGIAKNKSSSLGIPRIARSTRYILRRVPMLQGALDILYRIRLVESTTPTLVALLAILQIINMIRSMQADVEARQDLLAQTVADQGILSRREADELIAEERQYFRELVG